MKYLKTFEKFDYIRNFKADKSLLDWYIEMVEFEKPYDPRDEKGSNWKTNTRFLADRKRPDFEKQKAKILKELENDRRNWGKDALEWFKKNVEEDTKIKSTYEYISKGLDKAYDSDSKTNKYDQICKNLVKMVAIKMNQLKEEDPDMYDVLMVRNEKSSIFVDWINRKLPRQPSKEKEIDWEVEGPSINPNGRRSSDYKSGVHRGFWA